MRDALLTFMGSLCVGEKVDEWAGLMRSVGGRSSMNALAAQEKPLAEHNDTMTLSNQ